MLLLQHYKGPNIAGVDSLSGRIVRLFHPRKDRWARHFIWNGPVLVGQTRIGRATIAVLEINHPEFVAWREVLAYVWGGRDLRAVAPRSDSANFPGFFSILCSVFRDSVVTIFRVIS